MKMVKTIYPMLLLVATMALSSCLKEHDPLPPTYMDIVTVKSITGKTWFENDDDKIYYNSNNGVADLTGVKRAIIMFSPINPDDWKNDISPMNIDLYVATKIDEASLYTSRGSIADSLQLKEYDPIIGFDKMNKEGDTIQFKKGFITAKINYYFNKQIHGFKLYRYSDDALKPSVENADTVDLYFGHNAKNDDQSYEMAQYAVNYPNLYYKSFDTSTLIPELSSYNKDKLVVRINYRKYVKGGGTVDAVQLINYSTKQ